MNIVLRNFQSLVILAFVDTFLFTPQDIAQKENKLKFLGEYAGEHNNPNQMTISFKIPECCNFSLPKYNFFKWP